MTNKKGAGRPPKRLSKEQIEQVEGLASVLSQDQISDYFGICRPTFAAMIKRDPDICLRYKMGKAKAIGKVAQGLLQKARDGDTASAIFYLKTQAGWRETTRTELTGPDGGAIETIATIDVTKLSTEVLKELSRAAIKAD